MRAHALGIPVVTAGPLGFSAALLCVAPGACRRSVFDIQDGLSEEECFLRFAMGLSPRGLHFRYIDRRRVSSNDGGGRRRTSRVRPAPRWPAWRPCVWFWSAGLRPAPAYLQFDPYLTKFCAGRLCGGIATPCNGSNSASPGSSCWPVASGRLQPPANPRRI